jgi:hypothetical protein
MSRKFMSRKDSLTAIFKINKPIIGALHFMPLLGFEGFEGFEKILDNAIKDARALEEGGIDGIIFENNYDLPHKIDVGPETVASMAYLCNELRKEISVPHGISVLWNDYRAALSIANVTKGKFIRVPVFVDSVKTDFGTIFAKPDEVTSYRSKLGMDKIKIFTDIQVKHATMLQERPITESAIDAQKHGSDAIILTGKWTGNAPDIAKLMEARKAADIDIIVGSGFDASNAASILKYSDGAIVSTSLKEGSEVSGERNVKPAQARISEQKVSALMSVVKRVRRNA